MKTIDFKLFSDTALEEMRLAICHEIDDRQFALQDAASLNQMEKALLINGKLINAVQMYRRRNGCALKFALHVCKTWRGAYEDRSRE